MELIWHTTEIGSEPHEFPNSQERLWTLLNRKSHRNLLSFQLPPKTQLSTRGKGVVFKRLSLSSRTLFPCSSLALSILLEVLVSSALAQPSVKHEHRLFCKLKELGFENDTRKAIHEAHNLGLLLSDELFTANT